MSEDPLALYSITSTMPSSDPSVLPSESDYEAICAAVMESLRGRWFLAEYARRNRHSDTKVVLSAIERIEAMIRGDSVATPADRFRTELADMAEAIARTKSEIAAIKPEAEQPGKILEASEELDSIVHATETATSKILAAAEQIQEIAWTVREQDLAAPICDQLDALATDIYTACSFQDLTGQRIQKVIHAMRYLEERIDTMIHIWDDGVSAQAGSTATAEAAPADAAQAAHPAHHDVAQDDLDQIDVDMVMDPVQADAAIQAVPDTGVTIDHEPLKAAEPPMPEAVQEREIAPESFAPEGMVPESFASEELASNDSASAGAAPENVTAAETPEEVPVFFRAMAPSGPVAEPAPAHDTPAPAMAAASAPAIVAESETTAAPATDLAPTIAAVREALFGAFPGLIDRKADQPDDTMTPAAVNDDEPAAELFEAAPAVAERAAAESEIASAEPDSRLAELELVSGAAVDEIEERATPTLVGPADFLLEPLPAPALRELETVAPVAEPEPEAAIAPAAEEPEIETVDIETLEIEATRTRIAKVEVAAIEPAAAAEPTEAFEHDIVAIETAGAELIDAAEQPEAIGEAETAPHAIQAAAAEAEREAAVIEAVGPEPIEAADTLAEPIAEAHDNETAVDADEIAEIEAAELGAAEPEAAAAGPVSEPAFDEPVTAFAAESDDAGTAEAEPAPSEAAALEIAEIEITEIEITEIEIAEIEIAPIEIPDSGIVAAEAVESDTEADAARIDTVEAEASTDLTVAPEAVAFGTAELGTAELEAAGPETAAPELAASETVPEAIELDMVEIAEIEAVATAPVPPEAVAEADDAEPEAPAEAELQAKTEEPAPVTAGQEAQKEAEQEERPVARTAMPDVTFASMAPVMMPMESTHGEPAHERFAAAATATPAQDDFVPFGHVAAQPAGSPRPITVTSPSIYSTSPYLESSRNGAAQVTHADPLAAITALTDDEKIALFS